MSEHESKCGMKPPPRVSFAVNVIADMRQRFFDGKDAEILFVQNPMRRLQFYAEQVSYAAYQRRIDRYLKKQEAKQCHPMPSQSADSP